MFSLKNKWIKEVYVHDFKIRTNIAAQCSFLFKMGGNSSPIYLLDDKQVLELLVKIIYLR